jgi:hypothetical protein
MESMGRMLSGPVSQMLEIFHRGKERNCFFLFLFLQRLAKELLSNLDDKEGT